jgi:hypothetical protein
MDFSKMLSPIPISGVKATGEPLFKLPLEQLGLTTVIMSFFRAAAKTQWCIASTRAVASNRGFAPATLRAAPQSPDFRFLADIVANGFEVSKEATLIQDQPAIRKG